MSLDKENDEVTAEQPKPGVSGFRDYARNDEVEGPALCGEYRDVMLRAPLSCCANHHVMLRAVAASRNACGTL